MKCRTSFFNKGIFLNDLKRFSWIGIVYLIALLFEIPLKILMLSSEDPNYRRSMGYLFHFNSEIQIFLMFIIPVLTAVILFRYIQSKKSVDMIHCLPVRREKLYDNHILTGIILLIMPVIITAIISWVLKITLDISNDDYTVTLIFYWAGITVLFNMIIFLFCVFIGMLTGLSTAQGILTYIFLFLPVGLGFLIIYNVNLFIFGLVYNHSIEYELLKFSPLTRILELSNIMQWNEIIIYIIVCVILFFAARFVYKKRKLETVSMAVAVPKLQPVFKYGVTFCCMLVGGFYFAGVQMTSIYWVLFGYAAASLIGYYIAEMIIKKSLKIFRNVKGYFIFAGVIIILLVGINTDIIGYEKRIPDLNQVESICIDDYIRDCYYDYDKSQTDLKNDFFEKENLKNIIKFHKNIIQNKKAIKFNNKNQQQSISFVYKLKSGKELKRRYYIPEKMYDEFFQPICESKEYKKMNYYILSVDYNKVDKIRINANDSDKQAVIIDPSEIKEAIEILQKEKLNETYEESCDERRGWGVISILLSDDSSLNFEWKKSYTEFEKWLTRKGYLENSRVMSEDIKYVVVEKRIVDNHNQRDIELENENIKRLDIYDKSKIETCLRNYCWRGRGEYILGFYSEDGENVFYGGLEDKYVPDFVKVYFQD